MSLGKEKGCETCKHINKTEFEMPCLNCKRNATDNYEPMPKKTNYDLIKDMTVPEMVKFLKSHIDCRKCPCPSCTADFCANELEKWLESEVET